MKLGILGGTFDPVHIGHLIIAEEARVRLDLDEVLFIPTGQPWFKAGQHISDGLHRLTMVELAIASNAYFRASDMEIVRPGPTYTVETLEQLRQEEGSEMKIHLLLGLDALRQLDRWHKPQRLFALCTVVGIARPGFLVIDPHALEAISPGASKNVVLLNGPLIGVSGAEIRRRVSLGLSIKYQVPEPVEAYIHEHGLYTAGVEAASRGGAIEQVNY